LNRACKTDAKEVRIAAFAVGRTIFMRLGDLKDLTFTVVIGLVWRINGINDGAHRSRGDLHTMEAQNQESNEYQSRPVEAKVHLRARLTHYRDLLLRKWWVMALGVVLGLGVAGAFLFYQPRLFVSTGRMIVSIKLAIPEGSVYSEELGNFLGTQTALMRSGVVLNRAQARVLARSPGSVPSPVTLRVAVSPKTSIFVLEAVGPDALNVQTFLQACMEEYIKLKKEMRAQTSDNTVAGLTEEVLRLEGDLRNCEGELMRFQRSNSVVLLQEQGNSFGGYVATLNQRLAALRTEDAFLRSLTPGQNFGPGKELISGSLNDAPETASLTVSSSVENQPGTEVLRARQQIRALKADHQDLGRYLRPKHPKMIALSEDISRRETLLSILIEQSALELENRKASLAKQMMYLEQILADWNGKALDCSQKMAEYQRLKANQQRVQTLYDRLVATLQTLDLNKEISPESVTVLEPASPGFPDQHNSLSHFLTAGALAAVLSLGFLLFLDHVDDRLKNFTQLQEWFGEPVLVQVPLEKPQAGGTDVPLLSHDDSRHAFVEACRSLRSSLLFQGRGGKKPHILLLTSSVPSEGKSLVSANLAITMAGAKSRVLLIDADLRKGVLHQRFGLVPKFGLSEVLANQMPWEKAVIETSQPGLSLLARGAPTSASGELFLTDLTQKLLAEAAAQYEFVILDAAPVMAADDVTSLAPRVDGVLFVLRADHTPARVARAALELLYRRQVNVLGIVFNAVRPGNANYYTYTKQPPYT